MLFHIIVIIFLIGLGILFMLGKGAFLIAGYNTLSKIEKVKIDIVALGKFMGKIMFMVAGCITFWLTDELFPNLYLFIIGQILLIAVLLFALIYANTNNRFKINK